MAALAALPGFGREGELGRPCLDGVFGGNLRGDFREDFRQCGVAMQAADQYAPGFTAPVGAC